MEFNLSNLKEYKLFKVTLNHIILLRRLYIDPQPSSYCVMVPGVDPKRPYGNKDWLGDMYEILNGIPLLRKLTEKEEKMFRTLHQELSIALQIVLVTGEFNTGIYIQQDKYNQKSWKFYKEIDE